MEEKYTTSEFILKMIGPLYPYGDTDIDVARLYNTEIALKVLWLIVEELVKSAELKDRVEWSISEIANKSYDGLYEIATYISDKIFDVTLD